jgi:hypothetical protein
MASLKEILHTLAEGISLTGPAREELHRAIEDHDQAPADDDVSRETEVDTVSGPSKPEPPKGATVPRGAGA